MSSNRRHCPPSPLRLVCALQVYNSPGDSVYMFKPTSPAVPKPLSGCSMVAQVGPLVSELHVASASAGIAFTFALTNASTNAAANGLIRLDHRVGGLAPFDNLVTRFDGFPTPAAYSYHENGYERRPADYNTSLSVGNNYRPFVSRAALRTPVRHLTGRLDHSNLALPGTPLARCPPHLSVVPRLYWHT